MSWLLLSWSVAQGAALPPDYAEVLIQRAEQGADALLERGEAERALSSVTSFRDQVLEDPRLAYQEGLIRRMLGDTEGAARCYREVLKIEPQHAAAWYDLGELLLADGRRAEAEEALQQASLYSHHHPQGWAAPLKLAELHAESRSLERTLDWLEVALTRGFSFRVVLSSPLWAEFARDPVLGPALDDLCRQYEASEVYEAWDALSP